MRYNSNDHMLYETLRKGTGAREARESWISGMSLVPIQVKIHDDWEPEFIKPDSHVYKIYKSKPGYDEEVLQAMYRSCHEWMRENAGMFPFYSRPESPYPRGARDWMEDMITYHSKRSGELFYLTIFLRALFETDFPEKADGDNLPKFHFAPSMEASLARSRARGLIT